MEQVVIHRNQNNASTKQTFFRMRAHLLVDLLYAVTNNPPIKINPRLI